MSDPPSEFPMPFYIAEHVGAIPLAFDPRNRQPVEGEAIFREQRVHVGVPVVVSNSQHKILPPFHWVKTINHGIQPGLKLIENARIGHHPLPYYLLADGQYYPMAYDQNGTPLEGFVRHFKQPDVIVPVGLSHGPIGSGCVRTMHGEVVAGVPAHPRAGWSTCYSRIFKEDFPLVDIKNIGQLASNNPSGSKISEHRATTSLSSFDTFRKPSQLVIMPPDIAKYVRLDAGSDSYIPSDTNGPFWNRSADISRKPSRLRPRVLFRPQRAASAETNTFPGIRRSKRERSPFATACTPPLPKTKDYDVHDYAHEVIRRRKKTWLRRNWWWGCCCCCEEGYR